MEFSLPLTNSCTLGIFYSQLLDFAALQQAGYLEDITLLDEYCKCPQLVPFQFLTSTHTLAICFLKLGALSLANFTVGFLLCCQLLPYSCC